MLPLKEKDKPIVKKLLSAGCCARCVLRFCCVSVQAAYRQAHQVPFCCFLFISNVSSLKKSTSKPPCKRAKPDPTETDGSESGSAALVCVVCLGILQDLCGPAQAKKIAETVKAENYQFDTLVLSVSLPAQLCVREHSCWLHVKKEVREKGLVLDKDDVIQVKEAFKWIIQGLVTKELVGVAVVGKVGRIKTLKAQPLFTFKSKSFLFTLAAAYQLCLLCFFHFSRHYPCPPLEASSGCTPQDIQCLHVSVFIAGRYNKFCRSLPQTPWVIDGERRMESSVEELIAAPILSAFRADGFNFSSSGREDVDVRTLGNGEFLLLYWMVLLTQVIYTTINDSSEKVKVRDLQIVTREAMSRMKEGEEEKTKSYTALVWTQKAIEKEDIAFIDDIKVSPKTPLRVLHRRALAIRQRVIHSMNARFVDPHHFYLGLKTQAGTYIKEFVHGDFGRTKPNLCQLLKTDTDILELDVESVDVDWPPPIPE
uniref:tRNA pseudouridine(55) synthase n=1 Tax=Cyprinodon variegatus TaxID=28743 RepID=A0A3Q2D632_CYPVA